MEEQSKTREKRTTEKKTRLILLSKPQTCDRTRPAGTVMQGLSSSVLSGPLSDPYGSKQTQKAVANNHAASVRLLIVDDHSVVRRGAITWLNAQPGFVVVGEAETAEGAIAQAQSLQPDLVILDVGLGGEGGLSAAAKIVRSCRRTKVVAFSASADRVHVCGMLAAGATAYVLKTSEPSTLLSAIRTALSGSRFLDPGLSETLVEELGIFPQVSRRAAAVLSRRQTEVMQCIVSGYTNSETATELGIDVTSVNSHRVRICNKLGLENRAEIVRYGMAAGLMQARSLMKRPPTASAFGLSTPRQLKIREKC